MDGLTWSGTTSQADTHRERGGRERAHMYIYMKVLNELNNNIMQTEDSICLCCMQEETNVIMKPVVIHHDFDETGQEFDPIVTDRSEIVGFEDYCPKCNAEYQKQRDAELWAASFPNGLPF